jgi:hypothetical protein
MPHALLVKRRAPRLCAIGHERRYGQYYPAFNIAVQEAFYRAVREGI